MAPWSELQLTGLNNAELTERRNRSLDEYYQWQEAEKKKTKDLTYEMDHEATRQHMNVEQHQRDHIESTKKRIHDRETDILQDELDALEAKNNNHSDRAKAMAFSATRQSAAEQSARYKKSKGENIWGDNEVQTVGQ